MPINNYWSNFNDNKPSIPIISINNIPQSTAYHNNALSSKTTSSWEKNQQKMEQKRKRKKMGKTKQKVSKNKNEGPFHSKASTEKGVFLSNFQLIPGGLIIDGYSYPTVEHYYQSHKFPKEHRSRFQNRSMTAVEAKRAGCKGSMKKLGLALDMKKWNCMDMVPDENKKFNFEYNTDRFFIRVMKRALWERYKQDRRFRDYIDNHEGPFEHFEKKRGKYNPKNPPYWGCYTERKYTNGEKVGRNVLGTLYCCLRDNNDFRGFFEDNNGNLKW